MKTMIEVKNLKTQFQTPNGLVQAVRGVSFSLKEGETLGLVGESGSGKSVTALSIMRLLDSVPGAEVAGGEILYQGHNLLELKEEEMRRKRGREISMIFQEPMTSLNPVYTVGNQIGEVLTLHLGLRGKALKDRCIELLDLVGIPDPSRRVKDYPHQLSGGMRQRVMIAMALACNPKVLIADEPTTALDVTIQAQILELLQKLQRELKMSVILITHDLGVVAEVCHQVAVMYCGKIVEQAATKELFARPFHPYTKGLIHSIPNFDIRNGGKKPRRLPTIAGMVPSPRDLPPGCAFQDRCDFVQTNCRGGEGVPKLCELQDSHFVSCFHPINGPTGESLR